MHYIVIWIELVMVYILTEMYLKIEFPRFMNISPKWKELSIIIVASRTVKFNDILNIFPFNMKV